MDSFQDEISDNITGITWSLRGCLWSPVGVPYAFAWGAQRFTHTLTVQRRIGC